MTTRPTLKAFISYARDDEKHVEVLVNGLKQHSRLSTIFNWELWDDRQILAGEKWHDQIQQQVRECDFALLLISAGFFNSSYIEKHEYGKFLQKAKGRKRFTFFPVLVRACKFTAVGELANYQFFRANGEKYGVPQEGGGKLMPFSRLVDANRPIPVFNSSYGDDYCQDLVEHIERTLKNNLLPSDENAEIEALGLTAATPTFLEAEKNKPGKNWTPETFYLNKSGTQFWGLMNGLVAPRAITSTIFQHLEAALPDAPYLQQPILAVIAGSGGMGKSVLLRQIGARFAGECAVWFLEREELEDFDFDQALEKLAERSETQLVCLDNWEPRLPFKFTKCHKEKFRRVKFVLTAREPQSLNSFIFQGSRGIFNLDTRLAAEEKTADNLALISLALDKIPAWRTFLYSDEGKTAFAKAKPYQITFILNRLADRQKTAAGLPLTDDFQALFENIVDSDLADLQNQPGISGFADALVDFANLRLDLKTSLTKESFLRLADFHNQPKGGDKLFKNFLQKPLEAREWQCVPYYIAASENPKDTRIQETFLTFNKYDLVELVATAPDRVASLEKYQVRRRQVIEFLLDDKNKSTASRLLYQVATLGNDLTDQEKTGWIEKLMGKGNGHHAYASLLVSRKNTLQLTEEKRKELLERFVRLCPDNDSFLQSCLIWLKEREKDKSKRLEFIAELISWKAESAQLFCALLGNLEGEEQTTKASELMEGSKDLRVLSKCRKILKKRSYQEEALLYNHLNVLILSDPEKAIEIAIELIQKTKTPDILCRCLNILNQRKPELAAAIASKLIEESKDPQVLCRCLGILGSSAVSWALEKLENWEREDFLLVVRCLGVAFPHPTADRIVTQIMNEPVFNFFQLGKIFMVPLFGNQAWERRTAAILQNWQSQSGVDPVSWTLHLLGRRSPRCRNEELHIRRSSGDRWSSWSGRAATRKSWRGSLSRRRRRSVTGWRKRIAMKAGAPMA